MEEFRAIVSGRVQMVMFRDFVARHARRYGLAGFVRNLENGTVEVVAQGERPALEELLADLHKGSILANVKEVRADWREAKERRKGFEIAY